MNQQDEHVLISIDNFDSLCAMCGSIHSLPMNDNIKLIVDRFKVSSLRDNPFDYFHLVLKLVQLRVAYALLLPLVFPFLLQLLTYCNDGLLFCFLLPTEQHFGRLWIRTHQLMTSASLFVMF